MSQSFERRFHRLQQIKDQDLADYEMSVCKDSVVHWVNHWCYTVDPRDQQVWPFDLFPRQEQFLEWLGERERLQRDGLCEKSRDMGVTWLCCAYALHGWLFRNAFSAGFGSRKLELVDKLGDLDCIFEKIRFLLYGLPDWMMPKGFSRKTCDNQGRLVNPATGSSITGEGGDNIGRGGRKSIYFVDEAAFLEHAELIERSLSQTTRVRIDVSTPNGPGNPFATKRFGGRVDVFTLHWRDDPRKDQAWYDAFKADRGPVTTAQEVDIDYTASVEGITIPAVWVRAAVNLDLPRSGPVVAGLDVAEEGKDLTVFTPRVGPVVLPPVPWSKATTTETAWRARDEAVKAGAKRVCYDVVGVGVGVKGTWKAAERRLPFDAVAVNSGESPSDRHWPDGKTSKELFLNLRAELWWLLRRRFERAYEFREQGVKHRPEEMISIPNCPELIAQLSLPLHHRTDTGKIKIESKDAMARRGVKSPDYADSLCLAFYEPPGGGPWKMETFG